MAERALRWIKRAGQPIKAMAFGLLNPAFPCLLQVVQTQVLAVLGWYMRWKAPELGSLMALEYTKADTSKPVAELIFRALFSATTSRLRLWMMVSEAAFAGLTSPIFTNVEQ